MTVVEPVVSLDIDPEVIENTQAALDRTGYDQVVQAICADGENGYPADRTTPSWSPWSAATSHRRGSTSSPRMGCWSHRYGCVPTPAA